MAILKFLNNYNNYQNRIIKETKTYGDISGYDAATFPNINFDIGNGILTTQIVNWNKSWLPDYMLLLNTDKTEPASTDLLDLDSTWFVLDIYKIRKGQYRVTLKRDIIENFKSSIVNAPMFIEKAKINDINNPLIFNREGMNYNQIKKSETLLYDKSNTPWIVGYLNKKGNVDTYTFSINAASGSITLTGISNTIYSVKQKSKDNSGNEYELDVTLKGPNDTYGWTFDSQTHVFTWNTPWTLLGTNSITIEFENDLDTVAEFEYLTEPSGYINAEDLPWDFNPYDTMLGMQNTSATYHLEIEGIDRIYNGQVTRGTLTLKKDGNSYKKYTAVATEYAYDPNLNNNMFPLYATNKSVGLDIATWMQYYMADVVSYGYWSFTQSDMDALISTLGLKPYSSDPSSYNNAIVKYQGNFYRLTIGNAVTNNEAFTISSGALYNKHQDYLQALTTYWNNHIIYPSENNTYYHIASGYVPGTQTPVLGNQFSGHVQIIKYPITITRISNTVYRSMSLKFPASAIETQDAPYNMFCMPLNSVKLVNANVNTNPDATLQMALQLPAQLGSNLYDLQIVPYCPIQSVINASGNIVEAGTENIEFTYLYDKDPNGYKIYNACFFCKNTKGTFDLDVNLTIDNYTDDPVINKKIDSETKFYRLVSPNYNGQFEFKVSHNNDSIYQINVDYEYKPYTPYIHLTPIWNQDGLYGSDYNDARGLICGGDFGLPIINDSWVNYQIQNKNYQIIFDRQIQNMETNESINSWNRDNQFMLSIADKSVRAGKSISSGASSGGWAGALAAGFTSAIDIGTDFASYFSNEETKQKLLNEQISYATDLYNANLGNIQALPYSLSKVSSFNPNNKLVPILELYDSTDVEKDALVEKINYEGMNIQIIAKISDFLTNEKSFIRGRLIRLQQSGIDWMILQEIITELQRGVYI